MPDPVNGPDLNHAERIARDRAAGTPDLSRIAVGTFGPLGGFPADHVRARILDRAGVPRLLAGPDGVPAPHPLRAGLTDTHPSAGPHAARLPPVFPPEGHEGPLTSAQDWLDLIDAAFAPAPPEEPPAEGAAPAEEPPADGPAPVEEAPAGDRPSPDGPPNDGTQATG